MVRGPSDSLCIQRIGSWKNRLNPNFCLRPVVAVGERPQRAILQAGVPLNCVLGSMGQKLWSAPASGMGKTPRVESKCPWTLGHWECKHCSAHSLVFSKPNISILEKQKHVRDPFSTPSYWPDNANLIGQVVFDHRLFLANKNVRSKMPLRLLWCPTSPS